MLHLTRALLAARRELPALRDGAYRSWPAPDGVWAWRRGDDVLVAVNLRDDPARLGGVDGTVRVGTDRARDGEPVTGTLTLAPWEATVLTVR